MLSMVPLHIIFLLHSELKVEQHIMASGPPPEMAAIQLESGSLEESLAVLSLDGEVVGGTQMNPDLTKKETESQKR